MVWRPKIVNNFTPIPSSFYLLWKYISVSSSAEGIESRDEMKKPEMEEATTNDDLTEREAAVSKNNYVKFVENAEERKSLP
jgi:hypothetical protein